MYKSLEKVLRITKSKEEWLTKLRNMKNYNVLDSEGNSPLTICAYYGHKSGCELILNNGGSIDFRNKYNETPLKCAIGALGSHRGHQQIHDVILFLLEYGANVNLADKDQVSPLMEALRYSYCSDISKFLVEKGADINAVNRWKMTPLMYASGSKNIDLYRQLLDRGADFSSLDEIGRNTLYHISQPFIYDIEEKEQVEKIIALLLEVGVSVKTADTEDGNTLLHLASANGYHELVKTCIVKGEMINRQNSKGETPLILACKSKQLNTFNYLLIDNVDLTVKDQEGRDVMSYAITNTDKYGIQEFEKILIDKGLSYISRLGDSNNIDERDKNGKTSLMLSVEEGTLEKMEQLIKMGANVNCKDKHGKTALMMASAQNEADKVELLLKNGADLNLQDKYGKTALLYVMDDNFYGDSTRKKFDLLMEAKDINVNLQTNIGLTALMFACKQSSVDHYYIEKLFEKGADIGITNKKGENALSYVKGYNTPLKELLSKL